MALYLKQQDTRSELQEKLAKELQERAKNKPQPFDQPDGVDDSRYVEGTKKTTTLAWVWVVIFMVAIGLVIWIIASTMQ